MPPPYRPVFRDNFAPYGYPQAEPQPAHSQTMHRGSSAPPPQHNQQSRQPPRAVDDVSSRNLRVHFNLPIKNPLESRASALALRFVSFYSSVTFSDPLFFENGKF